MKVAILSGSVYGTAEDVARHAEHQLKAAGFETWHDPRAQLPQILESAPSCHRFSISPPKRCWS